jgi:hypothetical protein
MIALSATAADKLKELLLTRNEVAYCTVDLCPGKERLYVYGNDGTLYLNNE